mgnify:CR=1 FL=1
MQTEIEKEETHLVSIECKLKWFGYGEWVEECDKITFEHKGYACMVMRVIQPEPGQRDCVFGGHLCGYVKIPEYHYLHAEKDYSKIPLLCHGGLSYMSVDSPWIGFDCGHYLDIIPSFKKLEEHQTDRRLKEITEMISSHPLLKRTYKNMDFCTKQCISIVDQLMEIQDEYKEKESRNINA